MFFPAEHELVIAVYGGKVTTLCELGRAQDAGAVRSDLDVSEGGRH
ncbi:MAG: hypothetical protein ACM3ML_13575 [Micromonosporaceae bacterium]